MNFFDRLLNLAGNAGGALLNAFTDANVPPAVGYGGQPLPTATPKGQIVFEKDPTPTPTPTPQPQGQVKGASTTRQRPSFDRILDVAKYQGVSPTEVPLPNQEIQDLIWEMFPKEATPAAVALAGENAGYNLDAQNVNNDGTIDYGLFQNNSKTLNDMLQKQKYASQLQAGGINVGTDVLGDARKSALASKVTREYEEDSNAAPWAWWYGWQNKGYNPFPERDIQDVADQKYPSGNLPYFKLAERLNR